MSLMIGVISYLPENEQLRQKRLIARNKQAIWLKDNFPNKTVHVIAQCYKRNELIDYEHNILFDSGIGVGGARNVLIDMFYQSDYTHLLIMDDDLVLYDYYNPIEFLNDLDNNPMKYNDLDVILSSTPQYNAFKKDMFNDKYNTDYFKFSKRSPYFSNEFVIFKKFNKPVYYDDINAWHIEDADMNIRLMREGYKVYVADFMQMKVFLGCDENNSVVFDKGRSNVEIELRINLAKRYNIPIKGKTVQFKKAVDSWGINYTTPIYIKRPTRYNFPENLIPKEKNERKQLF